MSSNTWMYCVGRNLGHGHNCVLCHVLDIHVPVHFGAGRVDGRVAGTVVVGTVGGTVVGAGADTVAVAVGEVKVVGEPGPVGWPMFVSLLATVLQVVVGWLQRALRNRPFLGANLHSGRGVRR